MLNHEFGKQFPNGMVKKIVSLITDDFLRTSKSSDNIFIDDFYDHLNSIILF